MATIVAGEAEVRWSLTGATQPAISFFKTEPVTYLSLTRRSTASVECSRSVFAAIGQLDELESLALSGVNLDAACIESLPPMPTVRDFQWFPEEPEPDADTDELLSQLPIQFPNLQKLSIGGLPLNDAEIADLSKLERLEELEILGAQVDGSFIFDLATTKLRKLVIDSDVLGVVFLHGIREIPTIRHVDASRSSPLPLSAVALVEIDRLEFLSFRIASPLTEEEVESVEASADPGFSVSLLHESATGMGGSGWNFERVRLRD